MHNILNDSLEHVILKMMMIIIITKITKIVNTINCLVVIYSNIQMSNVIILNKYENNINYYEMLYSSIYLFLQRGSKPTDETSGLLAAIRITTCSKQTVKLFALQASVFIITIIHSNNMVTHQFSISSSKSNCFERG